MTQEKLTVLCVEARREVLNEVTRQMADAGYDVLGTNSVELARQALASIKVDGVLINWRMQDAIALREEIRRIAPGAPVLLFQGDESVLTLEVQVLRAWVHRARRLACAPEKDVFAAALDEYVEPVAVGAVR